MSRTSNNPTIRRATHSRTPGMLRSAALLFAASAAWAMPAAAQTTYYVDPAGDDSWTGLCKSCGAPNGPKKTIQNAIDAADPLAIDIVEVAAGTYAGPGNVNLDTRSKPITVRSAAGAPTTIIDGGGTAIGFDLQNTAFPTVIDGFTVANCGGYSVYVFSGFYPNINDCILPCGAGLDSTTASLTSCDLQGGALGDGGVHITGGSPYLWDCNLDFAYSNGYGGGLSIDSANVTVYDSSISSCYGIGVGLTGASTLIAENCKINDNYDGSDGGGVLLDDTSWGYFTHCEISRNREDADGSNGAGVCVTDGSFGWFSFSKIEDNWIGGDGEGNGGGLYVDATSGAHLGYSSIQRNVAWNDWSWVGSGTGYGGGVYAKGRVSYDHCTIKANVGGVGGGIYATDRQTMYGCVIEQNVADGQAGGAHFAGGAEIENTQFLANEAWNNGGGVAVTNTAASFERCGFFDNLATWGDGGAVHSSGSASLFDNCILAGNQAANGFGGGLIVAATDKVINCTVYDNLASTAGGLWAAGPGAFVGNSIFWANGAGPIVGPAAVSKSDVDGGYAGAINLPPKFKDPATRDFRLTSASPCIDAGSNALIPKGVTKDYNFNPRVQLGYLSFNLAKIVDMGAIEARLTINDLPNSKGSFTLADFDGLVGPGPGPGTGNSDINDKGNFMVAGGIDAGGKGRAFVIAADDGGNWVPHSVVTPPDGHVGDFFGVAIALGDDRLAVGAPRNKQKGNQAGAVYIYRLEGDQWVFESKLTAPDASAGAQFGYSVALEGDILLAGAWRADPDGMTNAGAVYAFHRDGDQWVHEATLAASDPEQDAQFGWTIGLSETAAIVGAPFAQQGAGRAYVYRRSGDQWFEEAILSAPEPAVGDQFGFAVGLWGRRAIVGAPGRDVPEQDSGAAYLFEDSFGQWEPVTEFIADTPGATQFGIALAIEGDVVAIGAPGTEAGEAEVFSLGETQWEHNATVVAEGGASGDQFGRWIALGSGTLAPGAPKHDGPNGQDEGAVYPFDLYGKPCYPDFTADGLLDIFDFLAYLNAFNAGHPAADCTADGANDLFDFLCFMNAFNNGC